MVTVVENGSASNSAPASSPGAEAAGVGIGIGKALGGLAMVLAVLIVGYFLIGAQRATERRTAAVENASSSVASSAERAADGLVNAINPAN